MSGKKGAKGTSPRGRKSKYDKSWIPKVEQWGKDGLIDNEIAKRLGISLATLYNYKNQYPEFKEAMEKSKAEADYVVKNSLFKKANGFYFYEEEDIFDEAGELVRTKRTKKFSPPDTKAILVWLQNREPEEWREKKDLTVEQDLVIDVNVIGIDEDEE